MEIEATIKRVLTKRTFATDNGQFTAQPLVLESVEEKLLSNGLTTFKHTFIADVTGQKAVDFNLPVGTKVVAGLQFTAKEGKSDNDKYFQTVRITYLRVEQ